MEFLRHFAEVCNGKLIETNILGKDYEGVHGICDNGNGEAMFEILAVLLNVLTWGVGIAATVGMVIAGYQYMMARDDASKVAKAKNRILQIVIGLVAYALMWGVLQFILPGGVFAGS